MSSADDEDYTFEENLQDVEDAVQDLRKWHDYELKTDEAYDAADQVEDINQLQTISHIRLAAIPGLSAEESIAIDKGDISSQASIKLHEEGLESAVDYLVGKNACEEEAREALKIHEMYQEVENKVNDLQEEFEENYGSLTSVEEDQLPGEEGVLGFKKWIHKRNQWPEGDDDTKGTFLGTPLYEKNSTHLY